MSSVYLFDSYIALYHIVIYLFVCFFLIVVFFLFFFFFLFCLFFMFFFFFFQAEDGIRDRDVTGVQTCALPICDEGEDCDDEELPHYRLLSCGEQRFVSAADFHRHHQQLQDTLRAARPLYPKERSQVKPKNGNSLGPLTPLPEVLQLARRRLADGRIRPELSSLAEDRFRPGLAAVADQHEAEVVVRGLEPGIEIDRVPERRLGFPVALEVKEGHAEAVVRQLGHGQRRQGDCGPVARKRILPAPALSQRHTQMKVPYGESRIELERLPQLFRGLIDLSEIQEQDPQA